MKDSAVGLTLRLPVLLRLSWRHHNDSSPQLAHQVIAAPKINASKLFLKLDEKTLKKNKQTNKQCVDGKPWKRAVTEAGVYCGQAGAFLPNCTIQHQ